MRTHYIKAGALVALAGLAACTSGQVGVPLPSTPTSLTVNKLQLAVGTANIGISGGAQIVGTNVVATYRQPNGLSGTLVNSPTLTGPAGWVVPTGSNIPGGGNDGTGMQAPNGSGADAGTTSLTSFPQGKPTPPPATSIGNTFGLGGGVFSYGFAPENSNNQFLSGTNFGLFAVPFFGAKADLNVYQGGPPAYIPTNGHPNIRDGFYPNGFTGFTQGFTSLEIPPIAGTYNLSLVVPTSPTSSMTISQAATLPAGAPVLGPVTITGFTADTPGGDGGGSIALTIPAGATETVVDVVDFGGKNSDGCHAGYTAPFNYSVVVTGTGAQTAVLPANVGPISPRAGGPGFQEPTICKGDVIQIQAVAADYPLYEAGPPQSTSIAPTIVGAAGTADISTANPASAAYGTPGITPNSGARQASQLRRGTLH